MGVSWSVQRPASYLLRPIFTPPIPHMFLCIMHEPDERGRICHSQTQPGFLVTTFPPRAVNHSDFAVVKTGSGSPGEGGKLVTRGRRDVDLESGRALVRVCVPCRPHSPRNTDGLSVLYLLLMGKSFRAASSSRKPLVGRVYEKKHAAHSATQQLSAFSHLRVEPTNQVHSPKIKHICDLMD